MNSNIEIESSNESHLQASRETAGINAARTEIYRRPVASDLPQVQQDRKGNAAPISSNELDLFDPFSSRATSEDRATSNPQLKLKEMQHDSKNALKFARKSHLHLDLNEVKALLRKESEAAKSFKHGEKAGQPEDQLHEHFKAARDAHMELKRHILEPQGETRACWFDRKTIVNAGPGELTKEIKELAAAGINTIYFECDNGGYATYNSSLLQKNPDLQKWGQWDPLRESIDAAHASGMRIEAWNKNFLGCNQALDEILRENHPAQTIPQEGPILSKHDHATSEDPYGDWALRQANGKMQPYNDLFMDPANPHVRKFVQDIMLELAKKYPDLDGLQYDYIRYPFHNEGLGLNANNWKSFQKEFPAYKNTEMPNADPATFSGRMLSDWNEWKADQVDSFVKDTSSKLREINPKLDIAAAVYPCDYNESLRQHWAKWLENGSVTTLNPMTYAPHVGGSKDSVLSAADAQKFKQDITAVEKAADEHGTILTGIEVGRVNAGGVLQETNIAKQLGLKGETFFASSVLDAPRLEELEMEDGNNQFTRFSNLLKASWSRGGGDETREQHQNFIKAANSVGEALNKLSPTGSPEELKPVISEMSELENGIAFYLRQNPSEKNEWTDSFLASLKKAQESLLAASTPAHLLAWDKDASR